MDGRLRAVRSSAAASVEHTTALVGGVGRRRGTEPPVTRCRPAICRNACSSGREGPAPLALPDPGVEAPDPAAGEPEHPGDRRAWFLKVMEEGAVPAAARAQVQPWRGDPDHEEPDPSMAGLTAGSGGCRPRTG